MMILGAVTLYFHLTNGLTQSPNQTVEFVDIRSVYHYSPEAANHEQALAICKMYSAWLISFDHTKEIADVTTFFFRDMPFPRFGEDIEIQTSALRMITGNSSKADKFNFEWHYAFKEPKHLGALDWCHMDNTLTYPIELPNFRCLKLALKRNTKKWCYKNYDCKNYVPFICERKLTWPPLTPVNPMAKIFADDDKPPVPVNDTLGEIPLRIDYEYATIESITCADDRYVRIASSYYVQIKPSKREDCGYFKTHIVYLETHEEAQSLTKYLKGCTAGGSGVGTYWTGGMKVNGAFRWSEDTYFTDENFCQGEPRKEEGYDFVVLTIANGGYCLQTSLASSRHTMICEKDEYLVVRDNF